MPSISISPHKYRKILYKTPRSRKIGLEIEADGAVDTYIVQASEVDRWRRHAIYAGASFLRRKELKAQYQVDQEFDDEWYLVLENTSDKDVSVRYDVFDR